MQHGEVDSFLGGHRMRILVDRDTYHVVWGDMTVKILDEVGALLIGFGVFFFVVVAVRLFVVEDIWDF